MKKKNIAVSITLAVSVVLLMFILAGCSFNFGPLTVDISPRIPGQANFNEKQFGTENNNFCHNQKFKNPRNIENIPFMGIEMAQSKDTKGVLVENVIAGSPAEKAGIKQQDIITAFNGEAVNNPYELYKNVLNNEVGDTVKITVNRNGENIELNLILEARSNNDKNIEQPSKEDKQT